MNDLSNDENGNSADGADSKLLFLMTNRLISHEKKTNYLIEYVPPHLRKSSLNSAPTPASQPQQTANSAGTGAKFNNSYKNDYNNNNFKVPQQTYSNNNISNYQQRNQQNSGQYNKPRNPNYRNFDNQQQVNPASVPYTVPQNVNTDQPASGVPAPYNKPYNNNGGGYNNASQQQYPRGGGYQQQYPTNNGASSGGDSSYYNRNNRFANSGSNEGGYQQRPYSSYNNNYNNNGTSYYHNNVDWNRPLARNEELERELFSQVPTGINFETYEDIPVEATGDRAPAPINTFDECNFHEIVTSNIKLSQYDKPTPVQKYAMPIILGKRDLMACAQTGSGKTAAFLVPILNLIFETGAIKNYQVVNGKYKKWLPAALILAPTRELALQVRSLKKQFLHNLYNSANIYYFVDLR